MYRQTDPTYISIESCNASNNVFTDFWQGKKMTDGPAQVFYSFEEIWPESLRLG